MNMVILILYNKIKSTLCDTCSYACTYVKVNCALHENFV